MEVDTSRQVKRKRSPDPLPMKKRKAYISQALDCGGSEGPDGGFNEREQIRGEVRAIYGAYAMLSTGGGDRDKRAECLDLILDAVRGSTAGKRLAARLIPKFMGEFPERFPRAVDSLLELCGERVVGDTSHQSILEALRTDALEGLGIACDKVMSFTDRPNEILGKVVRCVFRQLVQVHRPPHSGPSSNGGSSWSSELDLMLGLCEKAFRLVPREFLSCCLSAWREGDGTASAGASMVFEKLLLMDRMSMSECSYGSRRYEHSNGSRTPLAVEVLSKHPETMRWLGQTAYGIMQEGGSCQRGYYHLLDELMQKLPPQHQKSYNDGDQRHRSAGTLHGGRHGAPSSLHPPHLQNQPHESDSKLMPRTSSGFSRPPPPDSGMFQAPWNSETAHLMPTTVLPRHDDGPCLWFAALPHPLRKENLGPICSQYGTVDAIIFPSAPCHDKALVIFRSPREASLCCHHILNNPVLSGGRRICATVPAAGNPCHLLDPISTCVWVGGIPTHDQERDVLNSLHNANLPPPRHIIVVNGACPGFLLELQFISMVTPSLDCLEPIDKQNYNTEVCAPPPTNPPQMETRPGHSRPQEPTWKPQRAQANPMLPPGNWGTQATDISNRSPRHFPQPPPPRQPPPPLPESSMPESPLPPPPPLTSGNSDKAAERWGGHENGSSFDRGRRRFERESAAPHPRRPYWSGNLAKSGVTMCRLVCWQHSETSVAGSSGREPLEWPDVLDVRLRVDINMALRPVHGMQDRVLLRLSAGNGSNDHSKLKEFIKYLMDRTRAGVVHLRGSSSEGRGDRTMFLIPPTEAAAKSLGIEVLSKDSLIVSVVPARSKR